jgi:hypothetical protein
VPPEVWAQFYPQRQGITVDQLLQSWCDAGLHTQATE